MTGRSVLLLVAMESERRPIMGRLAAVSVDVEARLTGVGKVAAAWTAGRALAERPYDLVLVAGVAGGLTAEAGVGSVVVPHAAAQHDLDARPLTAARGEVPGLGRVRFEADDPARRALREAAQQRTGAVLDGLIVSGDAIIRERAARDDLRHSFPDAAVVDMETAAIAQVCALESVPWAAVRVVSDNADEDLSIDQVEDVARRTGALIADVIADALGRLVVQND